MKIIAVVVLSLLASSTLATEKKSARTCIKATQTERGRMTEISVAQTSGYRDVDRFAQNLVKVFKLEIKRSDSLPRQTGYAVVDYFQDGSFATTLFHHRGRLIRGCNDPVPLEHGFGT